MALEYRDLDDTTRRHMIDEIEADDAASNLYQSTNLNPRGCEIWPKALREAAQLNDDAWLARQLRENDCMNATFERRKPSGGTTTVRVSDRAVDMLAEGEFNRFYIRGVCIRALETGDGTVRVYRARHSENPRPGSELIIGSRVDAAKLLEDLRNNVGVETALGIPGGPNSGISVSLD